ncbi:MAG: polysaccharide deacetylase family protein, partial [Candidatus Omnitrophota bacterium]
MKKIIFFRNDDVRQNLDNSLIEMTQIFLDHCIPITHAVEPANVSSEVINYLIDLKIKYPKFVEIIQHGYNHKLNYMKMVGGKLRKGEFGGERTFEEQYRDIKAGKELMDKYFGNLWFPAFTFPYGARNNKAIKAINQLNYKVLESTEFYNVLISGSAILSSYFHTHLSKHLSEIRIAPFVHHPTLLAH